MPKFNISLSDKTVTRLQLWTTRFNQNKGTNLTLLQWIIHILMEYAIADELGEQSKTIDEQSERDKTAAKAALRDKLRGEL